MNWEYWQRQKSPKVSVVIPSYPASNHYNTCKLIKENQTFDDFEIIAINDASLDICEARNAGIREASAEIIALTDDDTKPPSEWVETIWDTFERTGNYGLIEGPVEGGINYDGKGQYVGCNLAFRREAAIEIGGFDSEYAGWRDDTEFGWRMERDSDWKTGYSEVIRMVHPPYPRANLISYNESLLKNSYPHRYDDRMNHSLVERLWRLGMRVGVVPYINQLRNPSR